jgi:hypothetical protein
MVDWAVPLRWLTSTVPIRLVVPGVSVIETADDLVADAVGISKRMLAKSISSTRMFFMKNRAVAGLNLTVPECQAIRVVVRVSLCVRYHLVRRVWCPTLSFIMNWGRVL